MGKYSQYITKQPLYYITHLLHVLCACASERKRKERNLEKDLVSRELLLMDLVDHFNSLFILFFVSQHSHDCERLSNSQNPRDLTHYTNALYKHMTTVL